MFKKIKKIVTRALNLAALFLYFCYKIVMSGWIVGWSVLKGYRGENGTMVLYRPVVRSGWALVLLFSLISMTPGSLSVDISEDNSAIHVHLLDRAGADDFFAVTGRIERMLDRIFN
ncbi:MAG: Na+/H+ antiporter subunit E [Bacteroidales bacterium]